MNITEYIEAFGTNYLDYDILKRPGPTTSKAIQLVSDDCWSMFGNHERKDIMKKIKEQPRMNPTDPKTFKSTGGGE